MKKYYQPKSGKKGRFALRENTYRRIWYLIADYPYYKAVQRGWTDAMEFSKENLGNEILEEFGKGRMETDGLADYSRENEVLKDALNLNKGSEETEAVFANSLEDSEDSIANSPGDSGDLLANSQDEQDDQFANGHESAAARFANSPNIAERIFEYDVEQAQCERYIWAIEDAMEKVPPLYVKYILSHIINRRQYKEMDGVSDRTLKMWVQRFIWHVAHNLGDA